LHTYLLLILRDRVGPTAGPDAVVDRKMPIFAGNQILTIVSPMYFREQQRHRAPFGERLRKWKKNYGLT